MATTRVAVTPMKVAQGPKPGGDFEIVDREIPKPGAGGWMRAFRARPAKRHDLSKLTSRMPVPRSMQVHEERITTSPPECQAGVLVAHTNGL